MKESILTLAAVLGAFAASAEEGGVVFRDCPKCDRQIRISKDCRTAFVNLSRLDGASGGMEVGYLGNRKTNYLAWNDVNIVGGGERTLAFFCRTGEPRSFAVTVDDGQPVTLDVEPTGGAFKEVPVDVALTAGAHSIRISNSEAWTPDFDKMEIRNGKAGGLK